MRIDPTLEQLRRDPAPQLAAQAALEALAARWRDSASVRGLLDELGAFGTGAALAECPRLDDLVSTPGHANRVVGDLFAAMAEGLRAHPFGHVPLRHQYAPGLAVMQLAASGRAALSLLCYEAASAGTAQPARSVCFAGGERHELCLAGAADIRIFEIIAEEPARAVLDCESRRVHAGDALAFTGPRRTKLVDAPHGRLVILRLARTETEPCPAREYRIADGALIHTACGDRRESGEEMAMAVLGAMARRDAVPAIAAIARSGSAHLRWQAMRQLLALDTGAGIAMLRAVASDPADVLAPPAGALWASLIERHPELKDRVPLCHA